MVSLIRQGVALAFAGGLLIGCGPSDADCLLGENGCDNGGMTGGGGWGNGGGGGPTYSPEGGTQVPLRTKLFQGLELELKTKCGGACHETGVNAKDNKWLAAPDAYASVLKYPGIVVTDVYASKLINRPANHPVASLSDTDTVNSTLRDKVIEWLNAEAVALTEAPRPTTDPIDVTSGTIDLTKAGIVGGKITFTAQVVGTYVKFDNMKLVAPASTGVHAVAPLFIMVPATGPEVSDQGNNFSVYETTVAATSQKAMPTPFYFFNWQVGSKIKVSFAKLETTSVTSPDGGADGGGTSSCKDVGTFQSSAAPTLINTCRSCHGGGNATATAAMDLSKLNGTPDYNAACTQARLRVNVTTKTSSDILLAPLTGSSLTHPVKPFANTSAAGYTALITWINKE